MSDIVSIIKNSLTPQLLSAISQSMGESEDGVKKAFGGIIPTILGALLKQGSSGDSSAFSGILNLFTNAPDPASLTSNTSGLMDALNGKGDLFSLAGKFLPMLLGNKSADVASMISNVAGIKGSSATSLLSMAAPLIMGHVSKAAGGNLSVNGLTSFLMSQKDSIAAAAPAGLGSILGLADMGQLGATVGNVASSAAAGAQQAAKSSSKLLPIIILAVLAALAVFLWKSCAPDAKKAISTTEQQVQKVASATEQQVQKVASAAEQQVQSMWAHLGKFGSFILPDGVSLNIPEFGIENKLLKFLTDSSRYVDTATWFSFDRLVFETNSATLKADSQEQLKNIAAILKAYPNTDIKLGGYTDNSGSDDVNIALSQQRADSVKNQLISLGVAADRLEAKGYGSEHPVAPNDTSENRAKNRRIDILVTRK